MTNWPDKPFILVIGTSHTHGSCKKSGEDGRLAEADRWSDKMAKHLGLELVNLSCPGTVNTRITSVLNDCFDLHDMSNCKAVLIECRIGTGGSVVALDNFNDYEDFDFKTSELRRDIYETTHYGNQHSAHDKLFATYAGGKIGNPDYYRGLISNAFTDEETIPDSALEDLKQYCNTRAMWYHGTNHTWWDDVMEIRNWQTMCKLASIPFKWFHWGFYHKIEEQDNNILKKYLKDTYTVFDDNLLEDCFGAENYIKSDPAIQCECKHWNEKGNELLWHALLKTRVDKWLKNK